VESSGIGKAGDPPVGVVDKRTRAEGILHLDRPVKVVIGISHLGLVGIGDGRKFTRRRESIGKGGPVSVRASGQSAVDVVGEAPDFLERVGDGRQKPPQVIGKVCSGTYGIGKRGELFAPSSGDNDFPISKAVPLNHRWF
jgi:hypothetical protein